MVLAGLARSVLPTHQLSALRQGKHACHSHDPEMRSPQADPESSLTLVRPPDVRPAAAGGAWDAGATAPPLPGAAPAAHSRQMLPRVRSFRSWYFCFVVLCFFNKAKKGD